MMNAQGSYLCKVTYRSLNVIFIDYNYQDTSGDNKNQSFPRFSKEKTKLDKG